jgi:hypothetical protein
MARPYNFFQFSESGVTGSGIVAAYRHVTSGFFTPQGMFFTPRGHISPIGDYLEEFGNVPDYRIQVSGNVDSSNIDNASISIGITGGFYPVSSGEASISFVFTGKQVSGNIDNPTFNTLITGSVESGIMDFPTYSVRPSGKIDGGGFDNPSLYLNLTGSVMSGIGDFPSYRVSITGNIVRYEKDNLSLVADIGTIEWFKGHPLIEDNVTDTGFLSIDIGTIIWRVSA